MAMRPNDIEQNDTHDNDNQKNDTQHNDIHPNDIQHNDIQYNDIQYNDIQHNDIQHNNKLNTTLGIISGSAVLLSVTNKSIMLSVNAECHYSECCYAEYHGACYKFGHT
jgi:hypothetical protein